MNTKSMRGHGLSRLLAGFLCLLLLVGIFPVSAFAASEGQQASSAYGDTVIGSDGQPYYSPSGYYTMTYHDDGSTSYVYHGGNVAYRHYVLNTDGGGFRWVYCIESGIRFGDSDDGYYSEQTDNSQYFNQLPEASRRGIMLASLYGWQPGASLPMAGINADDWYMAAQCIIWEYQQQLRSDATSRHDNGSVAENTFFRIVQGRPAEQVYYWILEQIASHSTIPSFAGATAESAPVHELKWDSNAKVYTLTLTDANNLNIDLEALTASGISVTRSGNSYTFTSKEMLESPVALQFRKNVPIGEAMLIWGREGWQTMMTGAKDPVSFYMQIKTETYGKAKIVKTSEDGIVEGIPFTISGNGVEESVVTGADGTVSLNLLPGTYLVTEQPIDHYVTPASQYITIESGQTASVQFSNILKKFRVEGHKLDPNAYYFEITTDGQVVVVENGESGRGFVNEAYRGNLKITKDSSDGRKDGFAFEVKSEDGTYCETFTSPEDGIILIEGLRVGKYTVTEVKNKASEDYIIPDGATVEIKADETAEVSFFNEKPEEETPETPDTPDNPDSPATPSNPSKPVPQTGDDYNLYIWIGVLGAAVIGSGVALFLCVYKKKGQKASPGRRKAATGVLLICIAMAVGSGFMLAREIGQYKESADTYAGLSEYVTPAETDGENGNAEAPEETGASSISLPTVDFESLLAQGPDVKAWLELPGTVIQYPVAQGEDNSYYLKHLYDGTANKVGCLFIDYENAEDFSDNNTIIYGHNMRDGSMFSTLVEYKAQAYYDEHPEMYLVTPEGGYVVEVFSAFVASPEESGSETSPWALEWKDSGAYTTWLSAMQERSVIETGVSVTSSDKVLTLSTCTNGGADRFIVMGRLVAVTE